MVLALSVATTVFILLLHEATSIEGKHVTKQKMALWTMAVIVFVSTMLPLMSVISAGLIMAIAMSTDAPSNSVKYIEDTT